MIWLETRLYHPASVGQATGQNPSLIRRGQTLVAPCPTTLPGPGLYLSLSAGRAGSIHRFPAVGQQFRDPAVGVLAHPVEYVAEVAEGIDLQHLAGRALAH